MSGGGTQGVIGGGRAALLALACAVALAGCLPFGRDQQAAEPPAAPGPPPVPHPYLVRSNQSAKQDRLLVLVRLPDPETVVQPAPDPDAPLRLPGGDGTPLLTLAPVPRVPDPTDTPRLRQARFMPALPNERTVLPGGGRSLSILQIGDSHTAADFMTAQLRRRLQAEYGDGGPGYLPAGRPHAGVRSSAMRLEATPGWTYRALQRGAEPAEFTLSGFSAVTSGAGERLTFASETQLAYDLVEIEVVRRPGGGTIDVAIDDRVVVRGYRLEGLRTEPVVLRHEAAAGSGLRRITITTAGGGSVQVSSVVVRNRGYGVTVSSVGYPGATIDILSRFDPRLFTAALRRLDPQIVVLAFGTNEGFNDGLDVGDYERRFRDAIRRIRSAVPAAAIVVMAPPAAHRLPAQCRAQAASAGCRGGEPEAGACQWRTPPRLDGVREAQRRVAEAEHVLFWNWADLMPRVCGAQAWAAANPRLMSDDRVHFTMEGYRRTADGFLTTLLPVVDRFRVRQHVVSNN